MTGFLNRDHFPADTEAKRHLGDALDAILDQDGRGGVLPLLAGYKAILSDNQRKDEWEVVNQKLTILFKCGMAASLDGPMIGVSISIRDSDYCLLITEPTPVGAHDLELSLEAAAMLGIPTGLVINRCQGDDYTIGALSARTGAPSLARIPFSSKLAQA